MFENFFSYKLFSSWRVDAVSEQEAIHVKTSQMCAMLLTHVHQWVHVEV